MGGKSYPLFNTSVLWFSSASLITIAIAIFKPFDQPVPPAGTASFIPAYDSSKDPKPGDLVPSDTVSGICAERIKGRHKLGLLVGVGTCTSCSLRTFDPRTFDHHGFAFVAPIYTLGPDEIKRAFPKVGEDVAFIADEEGRLLLWLNASNPPRFAAVDSSGRVVLLQHVDESPFSFVERCRNEL